jgi:hypothetical protein
LGSLSRFLRATPSDCADFFSGDVSSRSSMAIDLPEMDFFPLFPVTIFRFLVGIALGVGVAIVVVGAVADVVAAAVSGAVVNGSSAGLVVVVAVCWGCFLLAGVLRGDGGGFLSVAAGCNKWDIE